MNAGNADTIPAINHASASTRLTEIFNLLLATDHHANTGIEKPKIQRGMASSPKASIGAKDPSELDIQNDRAVPMITQIANSAHGPRDEGNSKGVPSVSRCRSIRVGTGVVNAGRLPRLCSVFPFASGVAFQSWMIGGLVMRSARSIGGMLIRLATMIIVGFQSTRPITINKHE